VSVPWDLLRSGRRRSPAADRQWRAAL